MILFILPMYERVLWEMTSNCFWLHVGTNIFVMELEADLMPGLCWLEVGRTLVFMMLDFCINYCADRIVGYGSLLLSCSVFLGGY